MAATTGYQAGIETTNTQVSYGAEVVWGTKPAIQFQALRITGESLSGTKDRTRPAEITTVPEVAPAVTTKEAASGAINFALSYGTFDDFFSGALDNDWQPAQVIAGIGGDITITTGTGVLSSSLGTKFSNITAGQFIRTLGFTNAANNGIWRVASKADNSHLTLAGPGVASIVTETPAGTAAQVRASTIQNSNVFKSFFVQQQLSSSLFLQYPGSFISGFTLSGGIGQFLSGSFNLLSQQEQSAITNGSTGAVLAAPTGRIHDPVGGFGGVLWNDAALNSVVDSFTVKVDAQGAQAEYGMGSATAQGMIMGQTIASGNMKMFFKDFTYYANFKSEAQGRLSFITKDPAGNAYVVTILAACLVNPKIEAGGPGQPVYASFDIEGNPQTAGGTIQLDRLAAS